MDTAEQATPDTTPADDSPTTYGQAPGFDYAGFRFGPFRLPSDWVVAFGMVHFRGPDGHLWFVPDAGPDLPGQFEWDHPQNVAEFDARTGDTTAEQVAAMGDLCRALDAARVASVRYLNGAKNTAAGR